MNNNDLSALLDNLIDSSSLPEAKAPPRQGVRSLGTCAACSQEIYGESVSFGGRLYHPPHFTCTNCPRELGAQFHEHMGRLLCPTCYTEGVARLCGKCNRPCVDGAVVLLGKHFHPDCASCSLCGKILNRGQYHEKNGKIVCPACTSVELPRCAKCGNPVTSDIISALGSKWHKDCFGCCQCQKPLADGDFFSDDEKAYCKEHYYQKKGIACAKCKKAVTGRGCEALGRLWHPECYRCSICNRDLGAKDGREMSGKPYCAGCYKELYPQATW